LELALRLSGAHLQSRSFARWNQSRDHGRRFVVHADEKLTAFLELEKVAARLEANEPAQRVASE
jgi:hypothetical protein